MAKGVLAILGSGETAPGMTKVHRELLSRLDEVRAVNLDTPYGFQLNVPQMTQKIVDYFKVSLQTDLKPLSFTNYEESSGVEKELLRQSVRDSTYVFAGPGSPSYALNQWKALHLEEDLFEVLEKGGSVCFSSAAALTLGAFTAPVYEIYKAGSPLYWLEGLNLMELIGLNCVVIPHFNNNEGESYDTSCCYLGKSRLEELEKLLPPETAIIGIDEHTALIIDLNEQTITAAGRGEVRWYLNDKTVKISSDCVIKLSKLRGDAFIPTNNRPQEKVENLNLFTAEELANLVEIRGEDALSALAKLVSLANEGSKNSTELINLINELLLLRGDLKRSGDYMFADKLRDSMNSVGIEVKDGPNGMSWTKFV